MNDPEHSFFGSELYEACLMGRSFDVKMLALTGVMADVRRCSSFIEDCLLGNEPMFWQISPVRK